jgi:hypothetical protein
MARAELDIVNTALAMLGEDPLADLSEKNDTAVTMRQLYPQVRDQVTQEAPWNEAQAWARLSPLVPPPVAPLPNPGVNAGFPLPPGWTAEYPLPADCLRILDAPRPWTRAGRFLLTKGTGEASIHYLARITDVTVIGPVLEAAIADLLAATAAFAITGNREQAAELMQRYMQFTLPRARAMNSLEMLPRTVGNRTLIDVRQTTGY